MEGKFRASRFSTSIWFTLEVKKLNEKRPLRFRELWGYCGCFQPVLEVHVPWATLVYKEFGFFSVHVYLAYHVLVCILHSRYHPLKAQDPFKLLVSWKLPASFVRSCAWRRCEGSAPSYDRSSVNRITFPKDATELRLMRDHW